MTITEILQKHNASPECIAEVEKRIWTLTASRKLDAREVARTGLASLKNFLRRDAARRFSDAIVDQMIEREDKDDEGNLTEVHYTLGIVRK